LIKYMQKEINEIDESEDWKNNLEEDEEEEDFH
jgi:hypothetical protein